MGPGEQRHCANDIICILAQAPKQPLSFSELTLSSPTYQYRQASQWQECIWRTMLQKRGKREMHWHFSIPSVTYFQWEDMKTKDRYGWMDDWNKWINEKPGFCLWQQGILNTMPPSKPKTRSKIHPEMKRKWESLSRRWTNICIVRNNYGVGHHYRYYLL